MSGRIAVVGIGQVGAAAAYALCIKPIASELLIVDVNEDMRDAQVEDLRDASLSGVHVRAATSKEAGQSHVIIITAGANQKPGESRRDLLQRNINILRTVINGMKPFRDDTVLLIVANPVDVLTYFAQKLSGLPQKQVLGSGTFLDSMRLRGMLGHTIGVDASSIHAFVIGEHGDSQLAAWSTVSIGSVPLDKAIGPGSLNVKIDRDEIAKQTKDKAARIIKGKGATSFGIGAVTASLCKTILFNERKVRPVSFWNEELGCCLSLPAVLGSTGVVTTLPLNLAQDEIEKLRKSAEDLKALIKLVEEADQAQAQAKSAEKADQAQVQAKPAEGLGNSKGPTTAVQEVKGAEPVLKSQ